MPRTIEPVPLAVLSAWPTKRLLGLRDRLLRCEESVRLSDVQDPSEIDPSVIRFKDDPRWSNLYDAVLRILGTREHMPGGAERKLRREEQSRRAGSRERRVRRGPRK